MSAKVPRGSYASVPLHGSATLSSTNQWEIHNQLEQVVGSDCAPHGWECLSLDNGVTVVVTVPQFSLVMPHTVYWRATATGPFKLAAFSVV